MTVSAAYDSLVTLTPGDYINVKPSLATKWARTGDGKGWRFILRDGVKFASGAPMTIDDLKWSFERVINLKDQPSQYVANIDRVEAVDKSTLDIILNAAGFRRIGIPMLGSADSLNVAVSAAVLLYEARAQMSKW